MGVRLTRLFEPITVGRLELKNRIVMLPVTTNYSYKGRMTPRQRDFHIERAKGGAGLVCYGFMPPISLIGAHAMGTFIDKDEVIPELRQMTDGVHAVGGKILGQIIIRYDWRRTEDSPLEVVAPTGGIVTGPTIRSPRELTVEEIEIIEEQYAAATWRAREAGFDMVEFHSGLGYLISRFMSPLTNKRTDKYGGSFENRMRFPLEIIARARKKAGSDYTIGCRISANDFLEGGTTIEDAKKVAQALEKGGADWLNVQVGWLEATTPVFQASVPPGAFVDLAGEIKKMVKVPVLAGMRINTAELGEKILADGKADLVGLCRSLVTDPYLPNKAKEGKLGDIRPCICCCECLDSQYVRGEIMGCSVNPYVGREGVTVPKPAKLKKVFIVGGGPAGMQAAIVASQRGHKVTLFEENGELGGQLIPAGKPPFKEDITVFKDYLVRQVKKEKVEVKSRTEFTAEILNGKPDAIIVSTGADPSLPKIPGMEKGKVVNPIDVLTDKVEVGKRALVVGGGLIGCETAEFLAKKGKQVTLTSRQEKIGQDIGASNRWVIRKRLKEAGVVIKPKMTLVEISKEGGKFQADGKTEVIPADTIILAAGMRPRNDLKQSLDGKVAMVYTIGDCAEVANIRRAVESGTRVAEEL